MKTKNLTIPNALRMTAMTSRTAIVSAKLAWPTARTHWAEKTVWPNVRRVTSSEPFGWFLSPIMTSCCLGWWSGMVRNEVTGGFTVGFHGKW